VYTSLWLHWVWLDRYHKIKVTEIVWFLFQSNAKGQSLRIQRGHEDDSDDPVYSDVDDAPTPPPHRKALGPTASLPAFRSDDDFYGKEATRLSRVP